ncbi:MAG: inositol-3-phosphate synthase [Vulcanimicrobiota bacterium]
MSDIRLAIVGVGNCASALVQGLDYYKNGDKSGLIQDEIGGYRVCDIKVVAAFDIDERKVGKPLGTALKAAPNCTPWFTRDLSGEGVTVLMGNILDGVAPHMAEYDEDVSFRPSNQEAVDVVKALRDSKANVLISYLPVGSEKAAKFYASCCLEAGVAMVNCMPVFIASDKEWADKFRDKKLPIVGDDIKSQLGATIVHRTLAQLFAERGITVKRSYQLNTGGNTDFLNMLSQDRLKSKRISKTEAVASALPAEHNSKLHIGPSDYVPWLQDNKCCFLRIEGEGFAGQPIELELRLSVMDSPNSAGCAMDAIRYCAAALDRGLAGPLEAPSAFFMKRPPVQLTFKDAQDGMEEVLKKPMLSSVKA